MSREDRIYMQYESLLKKDGDGDVEMQSYQEAGMRKLDIPIEQAPVLVFKNTLQDNEEMSA